MGSPVVRMVVLNLGFQAKANAPRLGNRELLELLQIGHSDYFFLRRGLLGRMGSTTVGLKSCNGV